MNAEFFVTQYARELLNKVINTNFEINLVE